MKVWRVPIYALLVACVLFAVTFAFVMACAPRVTPAMLREAEDYKAAQGVPYTLVFGDKGVAFVYRFVDKEAATVCYVATNRYTTAAGVGIACVPLSQTTLKQGAQ